MPFPPSEYYKIQGRNLGQVTGEMKEKTAQETEFYPNVCLVETTCLCRDRITTGAASATILYTFTPEGEVSTLPTLLPLLHLQ